MLTLEELFSVLGPSPSRVPLNVSVVDRASKPDYEQIKVEYDVGRDERISAYVLIPTNARRAPALFCHHQHASNFEIGRVKWWGTLAMSLCDLKTR